MDEFDDDERDNLGSVDPNGYGAEEAKAKSRRCPYCRGNGFAFIFDFEYTGCGVIVGMDDYGNARKRVGRTVAYCKCLFGRWILENHKKSAKDVYGRVPDFADIFGRSSFWLENDPTYVESSIDQIDHAGLRRMLAQRIAARSPQP